MLCHINKDNIIWWHIFHLIILTWIINLLIQFSSVQSFSRVWLFATPWIVARQASLSITISQSPPKPISIKSVMPSSHLILCCPLLLLPPIPPRIRVFSNESTLCMRWPKYWSFSFSIIPSKEHLDLISFRMDWLDLLGLWRKLSAEELMLLSCDVGEDSWESLGLQGCPTSPF